MIKTDIFQSRPRMIVLPDNDPTGKWPIVMFSPGAGENVAAPSIDTVDLLFDNGSPLAWARDGALNGQKDLVTGNSYNFLAVGLQGKNRICAQPWEMDACLTDVLAQFPQADASCILIGGLSAGGQVTWQFAASQYGKRAILAVPMSTPGAGNIDLSLTPKVWAFHGTSDADPTAFKNSVDYVNGVNAIKPGWAHLTPYAGGHGNWANYFNPNYTEKICTELPAMNIYQAALAQRSQKYLFTTSGTGSTPPPTGTTTASKMVLNAAAILNADGTATLSVKGSTGVQSFFWTAPPGISFAGGRSDGGNTLQDKITNKLQPGIYSFAVQAQDAAGGKATANASLSVPGGVILPTPPPAGRKEVARVKLPDVTVPGKTVVFYDNKDTEII